MKTYHSFIITGLLMIFHSLISAQDLHLQNGNQIKTIEAGKFIDVRLAYPGLEPCNECCNGARGELISYADGVLILKVHQTVEPKMIQNKRVGNVITSYTKIDYPVLSFQKDDILSITKKGNRRIHKYSFLQSLGMTLTLMGGAHLISVPAASGEDKDVRNTLLGVGITEMVTGIILGTSFRQKTYITSPSCPFKRNNGKIWVIN